MKVAIAAIVAIVAIAQAPSHAPAFLPVLAGPPPPALFGRLVDC